MSESEVWRATPDGRYGHRCVSIGVTPAEAARETGLPYKLFWRAMAGETWRHVQG